MRICTDQLSKMERLHSNTVNAIQHITRSLHQSQAEPSEIEEVKGGSEVLKKSSLEGWARSVAEGKVTPEKFVNTINEVLNAVIVEGKYKDTEVVLYILYSLSVRE